MTPGNFLCDIYMIIQQMVLNLLRWELNDSLSLENIYNFQPGKGRQRRAGKSFLKIMYLQTKMSVCMEIH